MRERYGTRAFELAAQRGWSLQELADRANLHIDTLFKLKAGTRSCGPNAFAGFQRAFPECSFNELFFLEGAPNPNGARRQRGAA